MTLTTKRGGQSPLSRVLSSKLFLGSTVAMFLSGLGVSAAVPQIVLFLVKDLGTSLSVAALYYLTSLGAPIAGYLIGRHSDRTGKRLGLFRMCALAGFAGWAGMALSTNVWLPFLVGLTLLAISGAASSQIFAAVHDEISVQSTDGDESVVAIIRMALTAGWVIGPVVGAWFASTYGMRSMLWLTSICLLLQIVPLGRLEVHSLPKSNLSKASKEHAEFRALIPILAFTGLFVLVHAGEAMKYSFLLIYMEEQLKLDAPIRGAVIGIQPLIELAVMPFSLVMGRKLGHVWLMCIAAALSLVANLCFAFWASAASMFVGQILLGIVWGIFMVLGIIVAQRLLPTAIATASAIFMSAPALSSSLGGVAGGLGVGALGLPHVFLLPASFSGLAVLGLAALARSSLSSSRD